MARLPFRGGGGSGSSDEEQPTQEDFDQRVSDPEPEPSEEDEEKTQEDFDQRVSDPEPEPSEEDEEKTQEDFDPRVSEPATEPTDGTDTSEPDEETQTDAEPEPVEESGEQSETEEDRTVVDESDVERQVASEFDHLDEDDVSAQMRGDDVDVVLTEEGRRRHRQFVADQEGVDKSAVAIDDPTIATFDDFVGGIDDDFGTLDRDHFEVQDENGFTVQLTERGFAEFSRQQIAAEDDDIDADDIVIDDDDQLRFSDDFRTESFIDQVTESELVRREGDDEPTPEEFLQMGRGFEAEVDQTPVVISESDVIVDGDDVRLSDDSIDDFQAAQRRVQLEDAKSDAVDQVAGESDMIHREGDLPGGFQEGVRKIAAEQDAGVAIDESDFTIQDGGLELTESATRQIEEEQLQRSIVSQKLEIADEYGIRSTDVEADLTGGEVEFELTDDAQRQIIEREVEEDHPDAEFEVVEVDGEFAVEFEQTPEDRDTRVGQWVADRSFEVQQAAERGGDFARETIPGEDLELTLISGPDAGATISTGEAPGDIVGGAFETTAKTVEPFGAALFTYDIAETVGRGTVDMQRARLDAAESAADMTVEEALDDPGELAGLTFDAAVLPREEVSERVDIASDVTSSAAETGVSSFEQRPVETTLTAGAVAIGSVAVPTATARAGRRGVRAVTDGTGTPDLSLASRIGDTITEARTQAPTARIVRDADSPLLDVTPGARRQLSDLTDLNTRSSPSVDSSRFSPSDIGARLRSEVQSAEIDAAIAVRQTRDRVRSAPEEISDVARTQAAEISSEVSGAAKGTALSAEAARFNLSSRLSRPSRPDTDFALSSRIEEFRRGVSDEFVSLEQSALLEAERQALRAREGVSTAADRVTGAPGRARSRVESKVEALPQQAALEAEIRLNRQRQRVADIQQRIESIPQNVESRAISQRERLESMVDRAQALPTEAALEAETRLHSIRRQADQATDQIESTVMSAARLPDELTVRVEPGRPPRQDRVIDVRDADVDVVSGAPVDVGPAPSPGGRISPGAGRPGSQTVAKVESPITETRPMARDGLGRSPVATVAAAATGASAVSQFDETSELSVDPNISDVDADVSLAGVEDVTQPTVDAGEVMTAESGVLEMEAEAAGHEVGSVESPVFEPKSATEPDGLTTTTVDFDLSQKTTQVHTPRQPTRARPPVMWPGDRRDDADSFDWESDLDSDTFDNPVSGQPFRDMAGDVEQIGRDTDRRSSSFDDDLTMEAFDEW